MIAALTLTTHAVWAGAPAVAQFAVRGAWESLAIGLFLAALLRTHAGFTPKVSFRLWTTGFLLAAAVPFVHWRRAAGVVAQGGVAQTIAGAGAAHAALFSLSSGWAVLLCAIWALGAAFALVRLAGGVVSLTSLVRRATPAPEPVQALCRQVAGASRRAARALVLESDRVTAPSACGLPRATILLPHGLAATLEPHELECILRHEAAHLARRDDLWSLLTGLTRAALPFSVAMPYLERGMARAREMVCDDAALACGVSRPGYAACLARMAEHSAGNGLRGLAPGLSGEGSQLVQRVKHILNTVQPPGAGQPMTGSAKLRTAAGGCAGMLLLAGMVSAPGLLTFHGPEPTAQRAVRVARLAHATTPALMTQPVDATVPLVRVRAANWTVPAAEPEQPRMDVASAAAMDERTDSFRIEAASSTHIVGAPRAAAARAVTVHQADPEPSVYLLWRRPDAATPAGVLLVVPGAGSMPSRFFLLTI